MNESFEKASQDLVAFQKMFLEGVSKTVQAAFQVTPESAPPEMLKQLREGIFQALAQSWDEFLRSPQFLQGMRQWMENAMTFRKISNDFMGRALNDIQAPSRKDLDTVVLAMRHMEQRLLDRLDELSARVANLDGKPVRKSRTGARKAVKAVRAKSQSKRRPS